MAVLLCLLLEFGHLHELEGFVEVDHAREAPRLDQLDANGRIQLTDL